MKIFNTLTRKLEDFKPINKGIVGVYTCGPTVYDYVTIGNWRTYMLGDLLVRTLRYLGYDVDYVMNITDVGHLTGDNVGDADTGEDRLEKAAKRERKTAWEVADIYTKDFLEGFQLLKMTAPKLFAKATDHIKEQIELVKRIEEAGFTYRISDGIYFDTKAYEAAGHEYGKLSSLDEIKAGARVEVNPEKKDPRDFALWKFSPSQEKRDMEWESPWGNGFPGWHIECSAMSMKYLGDQFDIHVGGEDLKSTHHPNEIAQSEAATGKEPFVNYWVHGSFLLVDGGRMGKSLGNAYTIQDIREKGFDPLALRYFYLTGHYRKQLNFTWKALEGAAVALNRLRQIYYASKQEDERTVLSPEKTDKMVDYRVKFENAISNDLDMPEAMSVMWEVAKSNVPGRDKSDLMDEFDKVFGLNISTWKPEEKTVPDVVVQLAETREMLRREGRFDEADKMRVEIEKRGFKVLDTPQGFKIE